MMNKNLKDIDLDLVQKELAKRKFKHFCKYFWSEVDPDHFIPTWSFDCMAEHLQAVFEGEIKNLVINIPPGLAKSLSCSVLFPAWGMAINPSHSFLCSTREAGNLKRDAFKFYNLLGSRKYQETFGNPFERSGKKKISEDYKDIQNSSKGFRRALTTGAAATGARGKIIVLDDPNDRGDVFSKKNRDKINDYVFNTLSTRNFAKRGGSMVIVMQRLHEEDVSGIAIERGFSHLKIPMEADGSSKFVLGSFVDPRKQGEFLNPEIFDEKSKKDILTKMTDREYTGQYQQRPAAKQGNMFKLFNMQARFDTGLKFEKKDKMIQVWDTTFKSDGSSYVVGQCWHQKINKFYLRDQVRGKWGFTKTCEQLELFYKKWPECYKCYVENKANGEAIVDHFKGKKVNPVPGITTFEPGRRSKEERADEVLKYWEVGNVILPENTKWLQSFIYEHLAFPNGANDDQVDVSTSALILLNKKRKSVFGDATPFESPI